MAKDFGTISKTEDFKSLSADDRIEVGEAYFQKNMLNTPDFKSLNESDQGDVIDAFFERPEFTATAPGDTSASRGAELANNPLKQFAIGAINTALMDIPLFALERIEGGGSTFQEFREFALDAPDTTAEHVARAAGVVAGFAVGLPAKVFVKGGDLALKAAAKATPSAIKLIKGGANIKKLTEAQRLTRGVIHGAGGFGAYETLKAPEDSFAEKAFTIPLSTTLGAAFGLAGEAVKPVVSRFVSNVTHGRSSAFTEELADALLTKVDQDTLKFESLMDSVRPAAAMKFAQNNFQGQKYEQLRAQYLKQAARFDTPAGRDLLKNVPYEALKHRTDVKDIRFHRSFTTNARSVIESQGLPGVAGARRMQNAVTEGQIAGGARQIETDATMVGLKDFNSKKFELNGELHNLTLLLDSGIDMLRVKPQTTGVLNSARSFEKMFKNVLNEAKANGMDIKELKAFYPHMNMGLHSDSKAIARNLGAAVHRGDFKNMEEAKSIFGTYREMLERGNADLLNVKGSHKAQQILTWLNRKRGLDAKTAKKAMQTTMRDSRAARFENLEGDRTLNLPFWEVDPRIALPEYFSGASNRLAVVRNFGVKDEIKNQIIAEHAKLGADSTTFETAYTRMFGHPDEFKDLPGLTRGIIKGAKSFEVVTKLGFAAIPNSTQSINTAMKVGILNTAKGIVDSTQKHGQEYALKTGSTLRQTINDVIARSTSGATSFTSNFLKAVKFNATETMNRTIAANSGRHYIMDLNKQLMQNTASKTARRRLIELGLDPRKIIKQGGIKYEDVLKGSARIVDKTQFTSQAIDLPLYFSSAYGKVTTQFKTFAFNQTRLIKDVVGGEAARGNFAPLITAVTLMPIIGEGVADVRGILSGKVRDKQGLDRIIDNMANVGSLGILSDLWNSMLFGNVEGFFLGPIISDLSDVLEKSGKALGGNATPLLKTLLKKIPLPGTSFLANKL